MIIPGNMGMISLPSSRGRLIINVISVSDLELVSFIKPLALVSPSRILAASSSASVVLVFCRLLPVAPVLVVKLMVIDTTRVSVKFGRGRRSPPLRYSVTSR